MTTLYADDPFPLGTKYQGEKVSKIAKSDPKYLRWFQGTVGNYCISDEVMNDLHQVKTTVPRHSGRKAA